jgi:Bacterial regulatory proteins, luxR family
MAGGNGSQALVASIAVGCGVPFVCIRRNSSASPLIRPDSDAMIARRLQLRPKTVRNHVSNIFTKLQVRDRAEAIMRARAAGMGQKRE